MTNADITSGSGAVSVKLTEALTEYVILSEVTMTPGDDPEVVDVTSFGAPWKHEGVQKARSAEDAIRKHGQEGRFVAIPARSWKPIKAEVKQTTTLDLKPAT